MLLGKTLKKSHPQNPYWLRFYLWAIPASALLTLCFAMPSFIPNAEDKHFTVEYRLNPNTASAGSLAQLPAIGKVKAAKITEYRKNVIDSTGKKAFEDINDLQKVKGIGPKTAEKIKNHLVFE